MRTRQRPGPVWNLGQNYFCTFKTRARNSRLARFYFTCEVGIIPFAPLQSDMGPNEITLFHLISICV